MKMMWEKKPIIIPNKKSHIIKTAYFYRTTFVETTNLGVRRKFFIYRTDLHPIHMEKFLEPTISNMSPANTQTSLFLTIRLYEGVFRIHSNSILNVHFALKEYSILWISTGTSCLVLLFMLLIFWAIVVRGYWSP